LRNNLIKRDGSGQRLGWIEAAYDAIPSLSVYAAKTEQVELDDVYPTVVKKALSDRHTTSVRRDVSRPLDGMLQCANVLDIFIVIAAVYTGRL
jgi:hypothetical protein